MCLRANRQVTSPHMVLMALPVHATLEQVQDVAGRYVLQPRGHHFVWQAKPGYVDLLAVERNVCDGRGPQVRIGTAGEPALSKVGRVNAAGKPTIGIITAIMIMMMVMVMMLMLLMVMLLLVLRCRVGEGAGWRGAG